MSTSQRELPRSADFFRGGRCNAIEGETHMYLIRKKAASAALVSLVTICLAGSFRGGNPPKQNGRRNLNGTGEWSNTCNGPVGTYPCQTFNFPQYCLSGNLLGASEPGGQATFSNQCKGAETKLAPGDPATSFMSVTRLTPGTWNVTYSDANGRSFSCGMVRVPPGTIGSVQMNANIGQCTQL